MLQKILLLALLAETLADDFDWSPDQILDFIKTTGVWNMMERQPNGSYL
jgi:hypothetical protein